MILLLVALVLALVGLLVCWRRRPRDVFVVHFSNYFPREVDSTWTTREAAEARAAELDGDWRVEEW